MLQTWARQHVGRGWVDPPNFGVSADLLKLESRVRILTSWLWLAQRYPDVYPDAEAVVALRQDLNAKIEEKLVASSMARTTRKGAPDGERQHRGRKPASRRGKPGGRRSPA
jgi:ATP-dependent RNA helicase SUPV3L1/SUV3